MTVVVAVVVLVSWGALAFGGVYPWAYAPLVVMGLAIAGVCWHRAGPERSIPASVIAAALGVLVAGVVQILPLPEPVVAVLSPKAVAFHAPVALPPGAAAIPSSRLPDEPRYTLSVQPAATAGAAALFGTYAALTIALTYGLRSREMMTIATALVTLGAIVAISGILIRRLAPGLVYGFWSGVDGTNPFGPFISRNHFAGWMLMATSLAWGRISAALAGTHRPGRPWRHTALHVARPGSILMVFAALAMMLALMFSSSRSGLVGIIVGIAAFVYLARPMWAGRLHRLTTAGFVAVGAIALVWTGLETLGPRFVGETDVTLEGRLQGWREAIAVARDFWLTGSGLATYDVASSSYGLSDASSRFTQAHNDYLEFLATGGALVIVPALFLAAGVVRESRGSYSAPDLEVSMRWLKAGAIAGLLAIAAQEVVEFSLQLPGNAVLCCVLLAIAMRRPSRAQQTEHEVV